MDIGSIKNAYRRYAPRYDLYFGALLNPGRNKVVKEMNCRPGEVVLEVGVGTGLALPLYDPSVRVVGIDISSEMLTRASGLKRRRGLENVVGLVEMDAEQMGFADDSFDKVVAMYVVSVVPDPVRLVNEMRRVCKPDGMLFFVNHFQNPNPVIGSFEHLVAPLSKLLGFTPDFSMETFISKSGLEVIKQSPVNLFGYWTMLQAPNNKEAPAQTVRRVRKAL